MKAKAILFRRRVSPAHATDWLVKVWPCRLTTELGLEKLGQVTYIGKTALLAGGCTLHKRHPDLLVVALHASQPEQIRGIVGLGIQYEPPP